MSPREPWLISDERPAIVCDGVELTGRALDTRADALAHWLAVRGVGRGDVVAAHLPNGPGFAELLHALDRLDAILLPLNRRHTESELQEVCRHAGAKLVVHGGGADTESVVRAAGGGRCERLPDAPPPGPQRAPLAGADSAALLLYTSGTTGRAKGALLTHANLRASVAASAAHLGTAPDDRWLACLPLFHIGGLSILLRCAAQGCAAVVHAAFDARAVDAALEHGGITHVSLVPTMLARLLEQRSGRRAPRGLRVVLLGGAGAPRRLLADADAAGWPIAATYGLTEASSQVATRLPGAPIDAPATPLPGVSLRIVDDEGKELAPGAVGEILVRGANVTPGYWKAPDATAAALRAGWLHTGDLGSLDAQGRVRVLDRRADLIVSGGENVYPAELEAVLAEHPAVAAVGVAGAADAEYGQRPVAFVVPRPGTAPDTAALRAFCRERLAAYKVPVRIHTVRALPTTAAGKLKRHRLREPSNPEST